MKNIVIFDKSEMNFSSNKSGDFCNFFPVKEEKGFKILPITKSDTKFNSFLLEFSELEKLNNKIITELKFINYEVLVYFSSNYKKREKQKKEIMKWFNNYKEVVDKTKMKYSVPDSDDDVSDKHLSYLKAIIDDQMKKLQHIDAKLDLILSKLENIEQHVDAFLQPSEGWGDE